jgi:hypothetical protein
MNRSTIRRLRSVISLAMSTLPHTARASGSRRQRGRLTLIVGQRRPTGFCHQAWLGSKGNRTAIPFVCAPVTVPASTMAPPACVTAAGGILSSAWRWRQPVRNWLRSGPASWSSIRCCMDCVTQISNYCLLAPSRRRQRLPVQLWGQLQRPCCVLGAATDSWSLQRRCSATITRVVVSLGRRSHRDRLDSS